MTQKRKLLLTFDYELFLGKKSGCVAKSIINPTQNILQILDRYSAKAIFFVDASYLWRLGQVAENHRKASEDLKAIQQQINDLYLHGQYIFLHIHPHWIDAQYNEDTNQWDLGNDKRFSFASLTNTEQRDIFSDSVNALKECIQDTTYSSEGFRAGGLFMQPFSAFEKYFTEYGIHSDFSVLPSFYSNSSSHNFDYRGISESNPYPFSKDLTNSDNDGLFVEYPLSVHKVTLLEKCANSLYYRLIMNFKDKKTWGDGISGGQRISSSYNNKIRSAETFSIELLNRIKAISYRNYLRKNDYLHIISHPKLMNDYSLMIFDRWMAKISNQYELITDYKKFD